MKDNDKPIENKNPVIQSMLENLAKETIRPEKMDLWPAVRADLATSKTLLQSKELLMNKKFKFTALAVVLIFSIVVVFMANDMTPVSAKEILDRAYQAQTQAVTNQGIEHIRNEFYSNLEGKPDGGELDTIIDSYFDSVSGNYRVVITDQKTGKVLQVFAFDGSHAYNSEGTKDGQPSEGPLTVYRSTQAQTNAIAQQLGQKQRAVLGEDSKIMFDKMRQDPRVQLVGQETWDNGHTVYVLRSQQEIKLMVENEMTHPTGTVTFYFDVNTFQQLGNLVTMEKDGKEVVISSLRILADEVLPEGSQIAWDLSDLQGIVIVDDPTGEHSLPVKSPSNVIPVETLASKTDSAYLLKTIPDGFSLEVSVLSEQPANEQFIYEASYTDQAGDYFIIRALGKPIEDTPHEAETYTTASGLVLHFTAEAGVSSEGGQFTALVEAPNGKTYAIDSTLPREQIKALAEELELAK